jgi:hypothetical protein
MTAADAPSRLERIYRHGLSAADIEHVKPNSLVVSPVAPPEAMGGIIMPGTSVAGANHVAYRVEKTGLLVTAGGDMGASAALLPGDSGDAVFANLKAGDVVTLRNGMLEPMDPHGALLSIDVRHILAVLVPFDSPPDGSVYG